MSEEVEGTGLALGLQRFQNLAAQD
jgi:hypothetical protein